MAAAETIQVSKKGGREGGRDGWKTLSLFIGNRPRAIAAAETV